MKRIVLILILLLTVVQISLAQTQLEKDAKEIGVSVNLPSFYNASENHEWIFPAEATDEYPLPDLAQQYGTKPACGNTFFNAHFGLVSGVLEHSDHECIVLACLPPGGGRNNFRSFPKDSMQLATFEHINFGRIKRDFRYGKAFENVSEIEAFELYSMLTHYPLAKAQEMFNAGAMVSYPLNFKGNIYKDGFTRGKALVIGKNGREVYLYFMMTDTSVLNFEKYLEEFDGAFLFNW